MSTNLEYREREGQKGESRRQASKAQREKERELELELECIAAVRKREMLAATKEHENKRQ